MKDKVLVLDANILLRAVFGRKALKAISKYADTIRFCSPSSCFAEAQRFIPPIAEKRGMSVSEPNAVFQKISQLVSPVEENIYKQFEEQAMQRISRRDPKDWPIVATALLLRCPIWTEDRDFFGIGIPTWVTELVEIFLDDPQQEPLLPAYPVT
jgi:predicted nucleic acid-binding protein